MSTIRVPPELYAALAGPLALRGLRATVDPDVPATIVLAPVPAVGSRWLALAGDATAAVAALDRGADDVVTGACDPVLIAARVAALLRRAVLRRGELEIDLLARTARRAGRSLALLPREFAILLKLARHADTIVTRTALREAVWGRAFDAGTNVIEVHVSRLRAALDRGAVPMLLTERGRGYRLVSEPAVADIAIAS